MSHGCSGESPSAAGSGSRAWVLRLVLTLALVVALALGLALGLDVLFPGFGRPGPGGGQALLDGKRVATGVYVEAGGQRLELEGLAPYEVVGAVEEIAPGLSLLPRDAYVDRSTRGAVPELDGRRLDVAAMAEAVLAAKPGESLPPVYYRVPAQVKLADFPDAPIYHGNPAKSEVAIILNVAWGDEFLDDICALVERTGGRLTICPVGLWLEGDGGRALWLGEAVRRGHDVGNHGYYNQPMTYEATKVREEIDRTSALIRATCGRQPTVFAPPMGASNERTLVAAADAGYRTVLWSLDTIDWRLEGIEVIAERVVSRVEAGDIILCHPTAQTAPAMERFLPALAEKGLRVVTLTQLLSPALPEDSAGP